MKDNKKNGIIVLAIIVAVTLFFTAVSALGITAPDFKSSPSGTIKTAAARKGKNGYIAALYIEGVIDTENQTYNQKWLLDTIRNLKNDRQNRGIALFVNSPGGAVYEADEAYLALQDYKTAGKTVYAYQANLAASGGYYISCAADKIYANRNTLTGSIGVITASSFDVTEMLSKIGVKSETIHAGKNKNMFNYNEPVSEEQKHIMQDIADECYEQFTGIVAMSRNIPLFEVKKLADGRIYTAKQALSNGLIDSIDTWENMISNMKLEEFDEKDVNLIEFRYKKDPSLRDMVLGSLFGSATLNSLKEMSEQVQLQYPAFIYQTK